MTTTLKSKFAESGLFMHTADSKRYFKASFEGFAGSGKSYTMGEIARGIWEREGGRSPVIIIDTEESAKHLIPLFAEVGVIEGENLFVSRSRSLVDFERILKLAEEERAILLIDSVTHLHEEMVAQYLRDNRRKHVEMKDHMMLKPFWKEHFSTPYVRAQCHALFTGRAAWEYEVERNEDTGKIQDFVKSGVKMRGDNETAFEPDILVLMTRCQEVTAHGKIRVWREGLVMKSRYAPLDGKLFVNPSFKDFDPVYQFVMTGKAGGAGVRETSMHGMFTDPSRSGYSRRREIDKVLGELKGLYDSYVPGTGAKERKLKADIAFTAFGKRSWEALEDSRLEELQAGYRVAEYIILHIESIPEDVKDVAAWLQQQKTDFQSSLSPIPETNTDDDVADFSGPDQAQPPQHDANVSGEGSSDAEHDAISLEATSLVSNHAEGQVSEAEMRETSDLMVEPGTHATAQQLAQLKILAGQVGEDADADLVKTIEHHGGKLAWDVYEGIRARLITREAEQKHALEA
jgi:hypothetical protein